MDHRHLLLEIVARLEAQDEGRPAPHRFSELLGVDYATVGEAALERAGFWLNDARLRYRFLPLDDTTQTALEQLLLSAWMEGVLVGAHFLQAKIDHSD